MDNTSVKIASLELENVKRIKAVRLVPTEKGFDVDYFGSMLMHFAPEDSAQ